MEGVLAVVGFGLGVSAGMRAARLIGAGAQAALSTVGWGGGPPASGPLVPLAASGIDVGAEAGPPKSRARRGRKASDAELRRIEIAHE